MLMKMIGTGWEAAGYVNAVSGFAGQEGNTGLSGLQSQLLIGFSRLKFFSR